MRYPPDFGSPWGWLCIGIMFVILGGNTFITGTGGYYSTPSGVAVPIVDSIGWIMVPGGIAISLLSIQLIRRGVGKPKKYTDEELSRIKEELDRIYFEQHGTWPKPYRQKDHL